MTSPIWEESAAAHRRLHRFARTTILVGVAVILTQSAISMHKWRLARALKIEQNGWASVEPEAYALMESSRQLRSLQAFRKELDGWEGSQVDWSPVLTLAQTSAPPTLLLRRMIVRQTLTATNRAVDGVMTEIPQRQYLFQLQGKAEGIQGPAVIADFVTHLSKHPLITRDFDSFKLQGFVSEPGDDPAARENGFSVKAVARTKEML